MLHVNRIKNSRPLPKIFHEHSGQWLVIDKEQVLWGMQICSSYAVFIRGDVRRQGSLEGGWKGVGASPFDTSGVWPHC